jgi:hypothetical protein
VTPMAWRCDDLHCARGQAENLIKRRNRQRPSDRTSCRSPLANPKRLIVRNAAFRARHQVEVMMMVKLIVSTLVLFLHKPRPAN